jgi:hypothetical protein
MTDLLIKGNVLPIWVKNEEATNLIKASVLKELRETGQIVFRTIEGKICYLLTDLLKHAGVENLVVNGEVHFDSPKPEVVQEELKFDEATEVDTKPKFYFSDLFPYNSSALPVGAVPPTFKTLHPKGDAKSGRKIEGLPVDIQVYKAERGEKEFRKARFIFQSLKQPNKFLILQLKYEQFFDALLADLLAECISNIKEKEAIIINIDGTVSEANKTKADIMVNDYTVSNKSAYIEPISMNVLHSKLKAASDRLFDLGQVKQVISPETDTNFRSNII